MNEKSSDWLHSKSGSNVKTLHISVRSSLEQAVTDSLAYLAPRRGKQSMSEMVARAIIAHAAASGCQSAAVRRVVEGE